jgi:hypothetical protein
LGIAKMAELLSLVVEGETVNGNFSAVPFDLHGLNTIEKEDN